MAKSKQSSGKNRVGGKAYELETPAQRRYFSLCSKKNIKPNDLLFRSLANTHFIVHLDTLDPEEFDLAMEFMQRFTTVREIAATAGKATVTREMRSKLERLGFSEPLITTQHGSIRFNRSLAATLYKSINLTRLDLIGVKIYPQSYKILAKGLKSLEAVTSIDFSSTSLTDTGLTALAGAFSHRPHLSSLNLSNCELTDASYREIAQIIRVHGVRKDEKCWTTSLRGRSPKVGGDGLQLLNLSHNQLGDATVETLCQVLVQDKWIIGLNLSQNLIGPRGIVHFVDLLRTNSSLLILKLQENTNADTRLVDFVENLMSSREEKIPTAVSSSSSTEENVNICRILSHWSIPSHLLPCLPSSAVAGEMNNNTPLPPQKRVVKPREEQTALDVLQQEETPEIEESESNASPAWAKTMMEQMKQMSQAQEKSEQMIRELQEENRTLRQALTHSKVPKKKSTTAEQEQKIVSQLESSIVKLAAKVQSLETSKSAPETIADSLAQQLNDVWSLAAHPNPQK